MKNLKDITLEMSLKPFKKTDIDTIDKVLRKVFLQWKPLAENAAGISIMLWTGDGSELLDYRGNTDDSFEWAYWIGCANPDFVNHPSEYCADGLLSFEKRYKYTENPPVMTYSVLETIVSRIKIIGKEIFPDKNIQVGTTIDPGPEFTLSDFKYNRHNEICTGGDLGKNSFICAYTKLKGDSVSYAGFPGGIPDGTPFGTFFGRQANVFMRDMGFDFIWMSNGLGFGRDPWSITGAIFDGQTFNTAALAETHKDVLTFWKLFRAECPSYPIRVRGSNNSLAIDYAKDGVPLKSIYDSVNDFVPPPNSPWAALTHDYGFELMGYMSRIAYVPNSDYMFRFYIHDPWWANTPWTDRYFHQPHDIYLPLAVSRIDENGAVKAPDYLSFLTIDNSYGELPDLCAYEIIPHMLKAFEEAPDDTAPFVWVYPTDECSCENNTEYITAMYYGDHFIKFALNTGLPLSAVTTADNFIKHDKTMYSASVIVSPIPLGGSDYEKEITALCKKGQKVIFYGNPSICSKRFADFIETESADNCILIPINQSISDIKEQAAAPLFDALSKLGYYIGFEKSDGIMPPTMTVHRSNNGYFLSAYSPSVTVKTKLKTPLGAPILNNCDTRLENGCSTYHFAKAERKEIRVFAEQTDGVILCRDDPPISMNNRRYIEVVGLKNATVRFFAEEYCKNNITAVTNFTSTYESGVDVKPKYRKIGNILFCEFENITGNLLIAMPR